MSTSLTDVDLQSGSTLPVIDLDLFLTDPSSATSAAECKKAADALVTYGALYVKDSRVSEADNEQFLDLLEDYFDQPDEVLKKDERKEASYQVGLTPGNTEKPRCASDDDCLRIIEKLAPSERPLDITSHGADPKSRFFYKMSTKPPYETQYPFLNMPNVIPEGFEDTWEPTLDKWGKSMKDAVEGVAEMSALGFGLERGTFKDAGRYGPHLLAPTASDLRKYGKKDTILAGFHSDLNFLTIHGRSRYPGLHVWARNTGKRIAVKVPPGRYLLVQAGQQLEHMTGGLVKAGFHEVVVNDATVTALEKAKAQGTRPLIRISSTFFWQLSSDIDLEPMPSLQQRLIELGSLTGKDAEEVVYPKMKVGEQVQKVLKQIAIMV